MSIGSKKRSNQNLWMLLSLAFLGGVALTIGVAYFMWSGSSHLAEEIATKNKQSAQQSPTNFWVQPDADTNTADNEHNQDDKNLQAHRKRLNSLFKNFFNDDIFADMDRMRDQMLGNLNNSPSADPDADAEKDNDKKAENKGSSPSFFSMITSNGVQIEEREDNKNRYFDIKGDGIDGSSLKIQVDEGTVIVRGTVSNEKKQPGQQFVFRSSFQRSFPVPSDVDASGMQMQAKGDTIVLSFPKL